MTQLLRSISEDVPYYKGFGIDLEAYPIVDKRLIVNRPEQFLTLRCPGDRSALIRVLDRQEPIPGGRFIFNDQIIVEQTSGSSGTAIRIPRTKAERLAATLAIWATRKAIDDKLAVADFFPLVHRAGYSTGQKLPGGTLAKWEELSRRKVRWVHLSPRQLQEFAFLVKSGRTGSIKFAEISGSHLDEKLCVLATRRLNVKIVNQYGCMEVWAIGYAAGNEPFEVLTDNVIVELFDSTDRPITGTNQTGRIVVTSLHQQTFPFVRYDTGDLGMFVRNGRKGIGLLLEPTRPNQFITGSFDTSGAEVFKSIMTKVNSKFGYSNIPELCIFQVRSDMFEVEIVNSPATASIIAEIERLFNRRRVIPEPATFTQRPPLKSIQHSAYGDRKRHLFTNCII